MGNERLLIDTMVLEEHWLVAAQETLASELSIKDQAEHYGRWLAGLVVNRSIRVEDLRGGVAWACALDKEAVERSVGGINLLDGLDHLEAVARRIAHHAGREARGFTKTERHKPAYIAKLAAKSNTV